MGDKFIEGISLWNTTSKGIPFYGFVILGLIALAAVSYYFYRQYTQKKQAKANEWNLFLRQAKEYSIDGDFLKTIEDLFQTIPVPSPIRFIQNVDEYDKYTNQYLKFLLNNQVKAGQYEDILLQLTKIRPRIISKSKDEFKPINSTEDLYAGLEVQIEVKDGPYEGIYDTKVASASKNNLVIHSPTVKNKKLFLDPGVVVHFTFTREDDAVYQFSSKAVGKFTGSLAGIVIQNQNEITKVRVRKYTRVNPNFLLKLVGIVSPKGDIHFIESLKADPISLSDISGGGMQINILPNAKSLNYITKDKQIAFSLYIPEVGAVENLKGKVIRVDFIESKGYHTCSIEFVNILSKDRCRILQGIMLFLSKKPSI